MEGYSTTMPDYEASLDRALAPVMPDSWEGHARLRAYDSDVIAAENHATVVNKVVEVSDEKGLSVARVADKMVSTIEEKRGDN